MSKSNKPIRKIIMNDLTDELRDQFAILAKGEKDMSDVNVDESLQDETPVEEVLVEDIESADPLSILMNNIDVIKSAAKRALGVNIDVEYVLNIVGKLNGLDNPTPQTVIDTIKESLSNDSMSESVVDELRLTTEEIEDGVVIRNGQKYFNIMATLQYEELM